MSSVWVGAGDGCSEVFVLLAEVEWYYAVKGKKGNLNDKYGILITPAVSTQGAGPLGKP